MESVSQAITRRLNLESLLLLLVLCISAFTRLYHLPDYLTFLGDEGRDVTVARRIITELHPTLIGPQTSIGNMYLGPLYYYLIAPFLWAFNFSPVGPAVLVAVLGVATVGLLYRISRKWYGKNVALVAAGLYAVSPVAILYSRSSWNPNIMPFFALLVIWSIWQFWEKLDFRFLIIGSISFAAVLQSHYLGLLMAPVIGLFYLLTYSKEKSAPGPLLLEFKKKSVVSLLIFALMLSPLLVFDLRHDFLNFKAVKTFFTVRQETVNIKPYKAIPKLWPIYKDLTLTLFGARKSDFGFFLALLPLAGIMVGLAKSTRKQTLLLFSCLFFGVLGLGLYKQTIYDHYYGLLFPLPFIFLSLALTYISRFPPGKIVAFFLLLLIFGLSLTANPLRVSPNYQLARTRSVSDFIKNESAGEPLNLALIAKRNYDAGYRYFLDLNASRLVKVEDQMASQLFVICEDEVCEPINHPNTEIARFGWARIESQWVFPWGTRLFKLVHSTDK